MSYFSLVQLQRNTRAAQSELRGLSRYGDAYRDHCLVWKLFPEQGASRDFLFRRRQQSSGLSYYVVSARPPQPEQDLFKIDTKPYRPQLAAGEWFRFELQANPTVTRKHGPALAGTRQGSKRHDVLMDAKSRPRETARPTAVADPVAADPVAHDPVAEAALAWLLQQGAKCGMQVEPQSVLTNAYTQHRLLARGRTIQFSSIDYCGVAQVTDAALLTTALLHGVGHARGFGCGLLLVRRME